MEGVFFWKKKTYVYVNNLSQIKLENIQCNMRLPKVSIVPCKDEHTLMNIHFVMRPIQQSKKTLMLKLKIKLTWCIIPYVLFYFRLIKGTSFRGWSGMENFNNVILGCSINNELLDIEYCIQFMERKGIMIVVFKLPIVVQSLVFASHPQSGYIQGFHRWPFILMYLFVRNVR